MKRVTGWAEKVTGWSKTGAGCKSIITNEIKYLCRVVTGGDGFFAYSPYVRAGLGEWFNPAPTRHPAPARMMGDLC